MNTVAEEPEFKQKFLPYTPERLPELIDKFEKYDCGVAVRLFEKINQEGREEQVKIDRILIGDSSTEKS